MPKRRRGSQTTDKSEESEQLSPVPGGIGKKRKKSHQYNPAEICQELYDTIRNFKNDDGRLLCETFIRVPKRRSAADYYDVVSTPIDMLKIQQKLKTDEYEEIEHLTTDVQLLVNNAKAYYKDDSQEYSDACDLWDLYSDTKQELIDAVFGETSEFGRERSVEPVEDEVVEELEDASQPPVETEDSLEPGEVRLPSLSVKIPLTPAVTLQPSAALAGQMQQLLDKVSEAESGGRNISEFFKVLPSREMYPDYYSVIKDPLDLTMVSGKVKAGHYLSLDQLEKDLLLIAKNARHYNEPGSQIYKDAGALKKIISSAKGEVEHGAGTSKSTEKGRSRRSAGKRQSMKPSDTSYVSEEDSCHDNLSQTEFGADDSGAEATSSGLESEESILKALLKHVKSFTNDDGEQISLPFMKLPSKKLYPDYYHEIKKPLSLNQIRKKIKFGEYSGLHELADDLDLVFENAKKYNTDESRLFQDAVQLQKEMHKKKKELDKFEKSLDVPEGEETPKRRGRPPVASSEERKKPGRKPKAKEETLKDRLTTLYRCVHDCEDENERPLIDIFMFLPSQEHYPDYYQVISEPIDMVTIEEKIELDKYTCERELINNFRLMFNNARHYNEENSQVYRDADTLEKTLMAKVKSLNPLVESPRSAKIFGKGPKQKSLSPLEQKLQDLYDFVKDFSDSKGRILSAPFIKLPSKNEYPDYYEVIKKPVDMIRITQKMTSSMYSHVEDMVADFVQMFDNACKYNEPDSLIYKDALTLQRVCLEKKADLVEDEDSEVPDVQGVVQELMKNLFISVYNYQDDDGRCYSDSFVDLPAVTEEEVEGEEKKILKHHLTFNQVKKNLDWGRYHRIDKLQEDMFAVFEYARNVSRTDSQLYEDAVEMQTFFLRIRDELCKNGELLLTPALSYTDKHLQVALEEQRREKLPLEQKEDEDKKSQCGTEEMNSEEDEQTESKPVGENSVQFKGQTYSVGDFVFIEPREKALYPHICCIERLWEDVEGVPWCHGNWFYRPNETFHLATRKFLEKEVFKSDFFDSSPLTKVIGKCYVMFVKEYFKNQPEGFNDEDIFVCESRYNRRHKSFKKIKIWSFPKNEAIKVVPREKPLPTVRVESVFAEKSEKDSTEDDPSHGILDKKRVEVKVEGPSEDGMTYYEQYLMPNGAFFKIGDHVYLRSIFEKPMIARIDKLWTDQSGNPFLHGPWFVYPKQVEHPPTKMFFHREVFLSSIENTNSLFNVLGKCTVLSHKDFCSCRPTEYPEDHVYICESKYVEAEKIIRKISKGFKKVILSPKVTDDEIYFFRKQIIPKKEPSPLLLKASQGPVSEAGEEPAPEEVPPPQEISFSQDVSMSGFENSMDSSVTEAKPSTKKPKRGKRRISAFIMFAAEIRRSIAEGHPEWGFGEISRAVGQEWAKVTPEDKVKYIEKAKKAQDEYDARQAEAEKALQDTMQRSQSPASGSMSPASFGRPLTPGQGGVPYQGMPPQQGMFPHQQSFGQQSCHPQQQMAHPGMMPQQGQGMPPPGMMPPHGGAASPRPGMLPYQQPMMPPMGQQQQQQQQLQQMQGVVHMQGMPTQSYPSMQHQQRLPNMQSYPTVGAVPSQQPQYGMSPGMPQPPSGAYPSMQQGTPMMRPPMSAGMSPRQLSSSSTPNTDMHRGSPAALPDPGPVPASMAPPPPPPRPPSPMFVTVPPKTQRLVHSEAYLKYIEGLSADSHTVSRWSQNLSATQANTHTQPTRLPTSWLPEGPGHHGNMLNALWAMRDLMLKDSLTISRVFDGPL